MTGSYKYRFIRESHTPLIRYQPKGPGQKSRIALIDLSKVTGARAQIEIALGELSSFEFVTGEQQSETSRPVLVWGKPGSNLAARLAAQPESLWSPSKAMETLGIHAWGNTCLPGAFDQLEITNLEPKGDHYGNGCLRK